MIDERLVGRGLQIKVGGYESVFLLWTDFGAILGAIWSQRFCSLAFSDKILCKK